MKNPRAGRELQEGLPGKTCGWTGNRLRVESQRGGGGGRSGGKALLLSFSLPPRPWAIVDSSRPSSGRMQPSRLALLSGGAGRGRGKGWGRLQQFIWVSCLIFSPSPHSVFSPLQVSFRKVSPPSPPLHSSFAYSTCFLGPEEISLFHLEIAHYCIVTKTNLCKLTGLSELLKWD